MQFVQVLCILNPELWNWELPFECLLLWKGPSRKITQLHHPFPARCWRLTLIFTSCPRSGLISHWLEGAHCFCDSGLYCLRCAQVLTERKHSFLLFLFRIIKVAVLFLLHSQWLTPSYISWPIYNTVMPALQRTCKLFKQTRLVCAFSPSLHNILYIYSIYIPYNILRVGCLR